jgi:hypothetical protein
MYSVQYMRAVLCHLSDMVTKKYIHDAKFFLSPEKS